MPHVFNELAQLVGRVEGDGRVYTAQGQLLGAMQPDGSVYDATAYDAFRRSFAPIEAISY